VSKFIAEAPGLIVAEGLVTLERVMHDGNRIRTRASGGSLHRDSSVEETQTWRGWWRHWGRRKEMTDTRCQRLARERAARERALISRLSGLLSPLSLRVSHTLHQFVYEVGREVIGYVLPAVAPKNVYTTDLMRSASRQFWPRSSPLTVDVTRTITAIGWTAHTTHSFTASEPRAPAHDSSSPAIKSST
jgi:hypothetical protein